MTRAGGADQQEERRAEGAIGGGGQRVKSKYQHWKQEFGALTAATWTEDDLKNLKPIYDSLPPVFGPAGSEVRKANDIFQIEQVLSNSRIAALPYFYLDSGTEDPF